MLRPARPPKRYGLATLLSMTYHRFSRRYSAPFLVTFGSARQLFFHQGELDLVLHVVDAVHKHAHFLAEGVFASPPLARDLLGVLAVSVAVVRHRRERHEAFDEHIEQLDEEAELGHADDQSLELFADAIAHELDLLPLHQLALGVVGAALGLAGFVGDLVQHVERNDLGNVRLLVAFALAAAMRLRALGPRTRRFAVRRRALPGRRFLVTPRLLALLRVAFGLRAQDFFQQPVHDEVGIAPDGRSEM